jgi:hypothetical protein
VVVRGRGQAREALPGLRGWRQAPPERDPSRARTAHERGHRLRYERTIRPAADFVSDCDHRVEVVYSAAHHWAARSGSYRHVGYVDKMTDG